MINISTQNSKNSKDYYYSSLKELKGIKQINNRILETKNTNL